MEAEGLSSGDGLVTITPESRELPVALSDEALLDKGQALAVSEQACIKLQEEKAEVAADFNSRIKGVRSDIAELAQVIKEGTVPAMVDCEVTMDFRRGYKSVMRMDTREVLVSRELTPTEQQRDLLDGEVVPDADAEPDEAEDNQDDPDRREGAHPDTEGVQEAEA